MKKVTKVKICGLTRPEDAKLACELGADMIGAIVEATVPTPRNLTIEQARAIFGAVDGARRVAVTTPNSPDSAERIARELGPDYLQIHSAMPVDQLKEVRELVPMELIGVVQVPQKTENPDEILARALEVTEVTDYLLLDTKGPAGGETGIPHDWGVSRKICATVEKPVFLSGGLNPTNIKDAIEKVRPYGVDVASGIESSPGKKDPRLMREFIQAARS